MSHESQRASLTKLVKDLQEQCFYGKVELDIQAGNILRVVKHQTLKLEEHDGRNARHPRSGEARG